MQNRYCSLMTIMVLTVCLTIPALAKTDFQVHQNVQLDQAPVDMLVTSNNKWIYVLNDQGQIAIYSTRGQLRDTIDVGSDIDQIKAGPRDDVLFLLSRKNKTVQIITVEFTENIAIEGSPYKGPADAPVVVSVFSDFQ